MVEWHHKVLGNNEAKEAEMEEWDMDNDPNPRWMSWEVFHREDRKSLPATVHLPGVPIDRVQRGFTEKEPLLKTFLNERDEDVRDQDEVEEALQKQMAVVSAFQAAVHKESLLSRIAKVFVSSLTKNDRSSHPGGSSSFDCSNKSKPRHTPSGRRIFHVGSMVVISKVLAASVCLVPLRLEMHRRHPQHSMRHDLGTDRWSFGQSMADGLQWASGNGRNRPILGCFAQTLPGRAGVNCMQFGSGEVIVTGGSEKASRSALSSERGWIQVWEVRQGDSAWTLNYTMGGAGAPARSLRGPASPTLLRSLNTSCRISLCVERLLRNRVSRWHP